MRHWWGVVLLLCLPLGSFTHPASFSAQLENAVGQAQQTLPRKQPGKKIAFLIGGACDEDRNNFVTEFNEWNRFLIQRGWEVRGFIDPAKKTEIADVRTFDAEKFLKALKQVAFEPEVTQVLVMAATHGTYMYGEHSLCASDDSYLLMSGLEDSFAALANHKIQTAFIDASCYSAYSVEVLQNKVSCVMSMAGMREGIGTITSAVAKNLSSLPTLAQRPSVEDVWFNVVNVSSDYLRQVPLVSGFPPIVTLDESLSGVDGKPWVLEELTPSKEEFKRARQFYRNNKKILGYILSPAAQQGTDEYFKTGQFIANSMGALPVFYLQTRPNRADRPCANFYF